MQPLILYHETWWIVCLIHVWELKFWVWYTCESWSFGSDTRVRAEVLSLLHVWELKFWVSYTCESWSFESDTHVRAEVLSLIHVWELKFWVRYTCESWSFESAQCSRFLTLLLRCWLTFVCSVVVWVAFVYGTGHRRAVCCGCEGILVCSI